MAEINTDPEIIDLREVVGTLWKRKALFIKVIVLTFVLSCIWIVPFPRTYTTTITLAPEIAGSSVSGALGSVASSFGIDLGNGQSTDAIYPIIYPDVIESTKFDISLFDVRVKDIDGEVDTTYFHYLQKLQKQTIWLVPFSWVTKQLRKLTESASVSQPSGEGQNVDQGFFLSKPQMDVIESIRGKISCDVDKKTDVITITVQDQDPLISATIADSVRLLLQDYIIEYRTKKARVDVDFYSDLLKKSKLEYDVALEQYSVYADSHRETSLETVTARLEMLRNEKELKLNAYNLVAGQLQAAQARLQERTPAFTVIQPAVVPLKATGPKRMIFVVSMTMLAFIVTCMWAGKDFITHQLTHIKKRGVEDNAE